MEAKIDLKIENMKPIKVVVCDDNPQERTFFVNMCKTIKERNRVPIMLKEYENGAALLFDMEDTRIMITVDIVLLDINMPGDNGIEVAKKLREYGYQGAIIFITKSKDQWKNAFAVKAFNYITKDDDLKERLIDVFWEALQEAKKRRGKSLLFSSIAETRKIDVDSISHFVVDQHLIKVYYDNERFDFMSSLAKIESLLFGNDRFMRIHRSCLISIPHIKMIHDKKVVMRNGDTLPISRNSLAELKRQWQKA